MKSSVPKSGKLPPLRSTTILLPPRTSPHSTAAGYTSIRLDTYHDTSDLRAALRKIEAVFTPADQEAPTVPKRTAAAAGATTNVSKSDKTTKATANVRLANIGDSASSRSTIVVEKSTAIPPRLPRRGPPAIFRLPPQLMIHCFCFCNLQTLGVLCRVSVRMNVLVARQGTVLWLAAAQRRRIPISDSACAREELLKALAYRARERHAEEVYYEAEIAKMEERLSARAQHIYAQNIDVDRTLQTNGETSTPAAASSEPFWLRQQRTLQARAGATVGSTDTAPEALPKSADMCAKLQTEIEALEEMKRACECRLNLQEELLLQHDAQLRQWQSLLFPCKLSAPSSSLAPASAGAATASSNTQNASAAAVASSPVLVSAAQVDEFERRMARLVLNGPVSTSSASITHAAPGESNLPVVLRRGVENFGSLELVLRAVKRGKPITDLDPANQDTVMTGNTKGTASAATAAAAASFEGAARAAVKRWNAFQKICPINEEYGNARLFLKAQASRAVPAPTAQPHTNTDGRSTADNDGQLQQQPSPKSIPALLRLSGFVRRAVAMSDAQVLQKWM
ncbi:conserved hypothetical protein [Leishmania mexicana MHOM/GT/2001/U1103]|uniref:F-box domain-containing protein n=1 Tax=Leishmania mexicana (strain MHOM/GT/2001/U1103) TaxID=929439 RepID=E9B4U4_LEIMU|nr:conserved hypothetical protein [Leishmania mexicana MHOM/GT/2001/U1103]CBZ30263.1 conserved hypothetical protein [Leishmania mexicana MHOM/GT/2001/U1103]